MVLFFIISKIFIGIIELPHMKERSTNIPYLIISLVFNLAAIGCKIYKHKLPLLRSLLQTQKKSFLVWVIIIMMMIFSWNLADNLDWNIFEKILLVLCEFTAMLTVTLILNPKFITKFQFIAFELIFVLEVLMVSLKTVGYLKDHS